MSRPLFYMAAMVLLLLFGGLAQAQKRDVLRVQFSRMAPWKIGSKGCERGVDIDFMRELAAQLELDVEFVHVPFARGLELMRTGEIDMLTGVLKTEKRKEYLLFIEPAYNSYSNTAFFVRSGEQNTIRSYEDLYGKRIGTTLETQYYPRFDKDMKLNKKPVRKALLNLEKLKLGRIDVVALSETTGRLLLHKPRFIKALVQAPYVHKAENRVFIALSAHSKFAPRLEEFNAAMRALVDSCKREEIRGHYLNTEN